VADNEIIDASIMNEIALHRFIRREVRLMLKLFEKFDAKLSVLIRKRFRRGMKVASSEYKNFLGSIKKLRDELFSKANKRIRDKLSQVALVEHDKEWAILLSKLGLTGRKPKQPTVSSALAEPFSSGASSASTLTEWLAALRSADFRKIRDALSLAASQGESTDDAVARTVGTEEQSFREGTVARTRNNIRALVSTAITHVARVMREGLWRSVPEVVGMVWVAILDLKTTAICRSRDNKVVMFGDNPAPEGAILLDPQGARPPAHPNCRSRMVALSRGAAMPDRETFDQFLRAQTPANQNIVLGETKAGMFRRGEITLDDFVDDIGNELTIPQLQAA